MRRAAWHRPPMRRLCVFCGSSPGASSAYADAARALAAELCRRRMGLVYGGGAIGLMGVLADAVLAGGGEVVGVIPRPLATREIAHTGCTELRVVESMHERKATMASLADGFVGLPGGLGTLEELCEMLTWTQLGVHAKPVGALDVGGYWDGLQRQLTDAVAAGFVQPDNAAMLRVHDDPARLLDDMAAWTPPTSPRVWLRPRET
jgi:uncharacterized protein (TIGR00730 family)